VAKEGGRILVADDDEDIRTAYAGILTQAGHEVDTASTGTEAVERALETRFDLILTDLAFPPTDGIRVLQEIKRIRPATLVVMFSGVPSIEPVLSAFRKGAYDFMVKPVSADALRNVADRAVNLRKAGEERRRMAQELESERLEVMELRRRLGQEDPFRRIVGSSPAIRRLIESLREVARTESTVLLTGESGTGKGLVARSIHEASGRRDGPFVEANCVVYSEGVLHSELFGHERGAFTGAARLKKGRFELASGGTLFLDEIGEISPATQLLLLRVLQERTFERVGGEITLQADARLLAATNRDLQEAMHRGSFRRDLYYRLNVIPVHLPPLRERREDIPALAQHFLREYAGRMERRVEGFAADVIDALMHYPWPGNVREIENVVERLVVLCRGEVIGWKDLPPALRQGTGTADVAGTLRDLERQRIVEALHEADGNKKLAARRLGIHRSTLYAKMRRYGLDGDSPAEDDRADTGSCSAAGEQHS
jgi:two-component system response regulator HydG